jgi:hypothetical protein
MTMMLEDVGGREQIAVAGYSRSTCRCTTWDYCVMVWLIESASLAISGGLDLEGGWQMAILSYLIAWLYMTTAWCIY